MKKKLLFSKLKVLCSIALCVLLLGSNFVFAKGELPVYNSIPSNTTLKDSPVYMMYNTNRYYHYASNNDSIDYFICLIGSNSYKVVFVSNISGCSIYSCTDISGTLGNPYQSNLNTSYSSLYYFVDSFSFNLTTDTNIPYLGSFSDLNSALDYYISNGISYPSSDPPVSGNFDLQVGNITFIDLGSSGASYDLTLKSYFNKLSGTLSGGWEYDNRRYGFSSTLPDTTFSVDGTSGSGFLWTKTDPKNILGRSHYGLSNISGTSTGRYLWIINPLYNENYYNDSLSGDSINGRINVSGLPAGSTFYTYPLVQSATSISLASDVATTSGGTGTVSETGGNTPTVSIDDPDSSYTQPIGGDNSPPVEVTLQEGVNQLFQTLKDFTEKVINLLSAPADFIQQLISAGQGFTQAIASMFTWLPSAVQDVLIAALGVMIVVGFLKLLF